MSKIEGTVFLHRVDEYGVFESACPGCFEVISRQMSETALAADEERHLCSELILRDTLDFFRTLPVPEPRRPRR
jgi:hypothetical protein